MSNKVSSMAFTNSAKGNKSNNNSIGGVGARSRRLRNVIINRSTKCCPRNSNAGGGNTDGGNTDGGNTDGGNTGDSNICTC